MPKPRKGSHSGWSCNLYPNEFGQLDQIPSLGPFCYRAEPGEYRTLPTNGCVLDDSIQILE